MLIYVLFIAIAVVTIVRRQEIVKRKIMLVMCGAIISTRLGINPEFHVGKKQLDNLNKKYSDL